KCVGRSWSAAEAKTDSSLRFDPALAHRIPSTHRAERNRPAPLFDRGDAVLPTRARLAVHQVERARLGIEREALPLVSLAAAKAEAAGAAQRNAEHLVEMRLVAMPADADADVIVG